MQCKPVASSASSIQAKLQNKSTELKTCRRKSRSTHAAVERPTTLMVGRMRCVSFSPRDNCPSVKSENQKTPSPPWRRPTQLLPQAQGESSTSNSPLTPSPPSNPTASSYWTLKHANALQQLTSQRSPPMSATDYVKWGNPSECSGRIWQLFEIGCG